MIRVKYKTNKAFTINFIKLFSWWLLSFFLIVVKVCSEICLLVNFLSRISNKKRVLHMREKFKWISLCVVFSAIFHSQFEQIFLGYNFLPRPPGSSWSLTGTSVTFMAIFLKWVWSISIITSRALRAKFVKIRTTLSKDRVGLNYTQPLRMGPYRGHDLNS